MRDSLSIQRWHGVMERGANFTMHIVYRVALIRIPSYTGGETLSLDLGDWPRLQGFMYLADLKGSSMKGSWWAVRQCLRFVAAVVDFQEDLWIGF